jgi:Ca2+-binding EF-hand superfamily protein
MMPVMAALDANGDGEISAEEITKSVAALNGLDKNKDGKLTMDELRPDFAGRGGERGGPGGERGGRGPGGPEGDSAGLVARLMALDKNQDGKLAKDEVEGRLLGVFERADADQDGFVTKQEIEKLASTSVEGDQRRGGPGEGGPGGGPGRGPGGFGGPPNPEQYVNRAFEFDADKDGKLSKEELAKMISEAPFGGGRGPGRPDGERGEGRRPARPESE